MGAGPTDMGSGGQRRSHGAQLEEIAANRSVFDAFRPSFFTTEPDLLKIKI